MSIRPVTSLTRRPAVGSAQSHFSTTTLFSILPKWLSCCAEFPYLWLPSTESRNQGGTPTASDFVLKVRPYEWKPRSRIARECSQNLYVCSEVGSVRQPNTKC